MLSREESCAQREEVTGELQPVVWYEELQNGKSRRIRGHKHRLLQKERKQGWLPPTYVSCDAVNHGENVCGLGRKINKDVRKW
jgi:hypothetical protein